MSEADVRAASDAFYAALNKMANGDPAPMIDMWAKTDAVTAMHPSGGCEVGWDAVDESFKKFASIASDAKVRITDQRFQVIGDAAYETAVERGDLKVAGHPVAFEVRVTNIYRRQNGAWKMVHHHADPSPALLDVLAKL